MLDVGMEVVGLIKLIAGQLLLLLMLLLWMEVVESELLLHGLLVARLQTVHDVEANDATDDGARHYLQRRRTRRLRPHPSLSLCFHPHSSPSNPLG